MNFCKKCFIFFITGLALWSVPAFAQKETYPFENEIKAFKHQDSLKMPAPGGYLFIGSSSIRMWDDLEQRFADKPIVKRGVGGSEISQLVKYYTPTILFPYQPSKIFVYAGENDIAAGKSADAVFNDFKTLWEMIREQLPQAKIYFLGIKPSNSRTKYAPEFARANSLVKNFLKGKAQGKYIDLATPILNKAGQPDSSLFKSDQLHLNNLGYDRWQKKLKPYL